MIEVTVDRIQVNLVNQTRVVILREAEGERFLPIWIGQFEAEAIAMFLQEVEPARPMTHDLLKSVLGGLGARLERLEIHDLQDDVFYARLIVRIGEKQIEIDSRPSDGIAVAIRAHAPIFVAEEVMERAAAKPEADIREQGRGAAPEEGSSDKRLDVFKDFIQRLDRNDKPPEEKPAG
ncbi:MAG: bifunctional nuclease family protein [Anaerolineales bacterium]|nr:bifunctional nuclease family protein [Anaerolineales bacterium]